MEIDVEGLWTILESASRRAANRKLYTHLEFSTVNEKAVRPTS